MNEKITIRKVTKEEWSVLGNDNSTYALDVDDEPGIYGSREHLEEIKFKMESSNEQA